MAWMGGENDAIIIMSDVFRAVGASKSRAGLTVHDVLKVDSVWVRNTIADLVNIEKVSRPRRLRRGFVVDTAKCPATTWFMDPMRATAVLFSRFS
jgi:hypothetical protein